MKILKNKYIQLGLVLVVGITIGILVSNSGSSNNLTTEHQHEEQSQTWTCSMHPQIRQLEPGSCPICGMDLIPLAEEQNEGIDPDAIKMSETAMKLANIQTI